MCGLSPIRTFLILIWGLLCLSIVAAPYLAAHHCPAVAAFLYFFYSPVCHQLPGRSFKLMGASWAVCQRCSGIYFGLLAGSLLPAFNGALPPLRRTLVLAATAPLALDALLPMIGIWISSPASRFSTGLLFGTMLSTLLLSGITEFVNVRCGPNPARSPSTEGVNV